jgi:hypothetical protein
MAARPETVEAFALAGVPFATIEAVTRYLAEARLLRTTVRGRRGLKRFDYDANDFAVIIIALGAHLTIQAPLVVVELSDHVPAPQGALLENAQAGSFQSLLAPLSESTTFRHWLADTFLRFAALTSAERSAWRRDKVAKTAFLELVTPPDIATDVGLSFARFVWGTAENWRIQEFHTPVPVSFDAILETPMPAYQKGSILHFPLLLIPGDLLAASREHGGRVPNSRTPE